MKRTAGAGWSDSTYHTVLSCKRCGRETVHELRYAGRILCSAGCSECGYTVYHEGNDLRRAYLFDLGRRVWTKPGRMARRVAHHPGQFLAGLPASVINKPGRLLQEIRPLVRRRPVNPPD